MSNAPHHSAIVQEQLDEDRFPVEADSYPEALRVASEIASSWPSQRWADSVIALVVMPSKLIGFFEVSIVHEEVEG